MSGSMDSTWAAVVPTTDLVMRPIDPDDVDRAWESREAVVEDKEPFSFLHRLITATRAEQVVLAAGHLEDDDGEPVVNGHLIDITDVREDAVNDELDSAVSDFVGQRAVIEQAKGVLMQLYSVDADTGMGVAASVLGRHQPEGARHRAPPDRRRERGRDSGEGSRTIRDRDARAARRRHPGRRRHDTLSRTPTPAGAPGQQLSLLWPMCG